MSFYEILKKDLPDKVDVLIESFVRAYSEIAVTESDSNPYRFLLTLGLNVSFETVSCSLMQDKQRFLLSDTKKNSLRHVFLKFPGEFKHGGTWKIYEHVPDEKREIGTRNPIQDFLKELSTSSRTNRWIFSNMQKFMRVKLECETCSCKQRSDGKMFAADQGRRPTCSECSQQEGNVPVFITETTGNVVTLHVQTLGLQMARDILRRQGGLKSKYAQTVQGHEDVATTKMILAASEDYILRMHLQAGVFNLQLHHTDDILKTANSLQEPSPIAEVSHSFHTMDKLVEQTRYTHKNQCSELPATAACDCANVVGLLAVTQALLRQNMAAQSLRSMGHNPDMESYGRMSALGITSVLRAMLLKTDDRRVAYTINRIHKGSVAKYCNSAEVSLDAIDCNSNFQNASQKALQTPSSKENVRVHYSSALSYAIAHQNPGLRSLLNYSAGLDMECATVALLSGISFCHSCAYKSTPSVNLVSATQQCLGGVHFINASDFDPDSYATASRMGEPSMSAGSGG